MTADPVAARTSWRDLAACRDHENPAIFFPTEHENAYAAKAVCAGCPVRVECLDFALTSPNRECGIWGGTSESERRAIRRDVRRGWHAP